MIETVLGRTIDIHGGGLDLIFPHHENEIAQSSCAHDGAPLARYWLHNGFLTMNAEKMSKSLGNVALVHDLLKSWKGEILRYALLSGHYRAPLDWTDALLMQAQATLDGWYRALGKLADVEAADVDAPSSVVEALEDDLNTPAAYAAVSALVSEANKASHPDKRARLKGEIEAAGALLGLLQEDPEPWFKMPAGGVTGDGPSDAEIDALVAARVEARKARNFAEADRIRDELARHHVIVEDAAGGSTWRRG
jgi:cysteinyl-tRNA synthetase